VLPPGYGSHLFSDTDRTETLSGRWAAWLDSKPHEPPTDTKKPDRIGMRRGGPRTGTAGVSQAGNRLVHRPSPGPHRARPHGPRRETSLFVPAPGRVLPCRRPWLGDVAV